MSIKMIRTLALSGAILFAVIVLLVMLAPGLSMTVVGTKVTTSVYDLLSYGDETQAGLIVALVFVCLALALLLCTLVSFLINKACKYDWIVAVFGGLLLKVAGVLFFCTRVLLEVNGSSVIHLGAGAIVAGVFSFLAAMAYDLYGGTRFGEFRDRK